jgi:hypothetical protein
MRKERLVNFQNIAPGQTALLTCPIGPTYEKLKINLTGGLTIDKITNIVGKINDRPFFTVTGNDLLKENLYEGRSNPTTLILLDFLRENAKSSSVKGAGPTSQVAEQLITALPSAIMQKLTWEFTIDQTAPGGSNMIAMAQLNDPSKNPLVLKQLYSTLAFPFAQDNDINLAVGRAGAIIKKLYLHQANYGAAWAQSTAYTVGTQVTANGNVYVCTTAGTSAASGTGPATTTSGITDGTVVWSFVSTAGSISYMQVRNQGVIIWEGTPADAAGDQTDYQKVQQAGLTVIDFDLQGFREKWINTTVTQNVFIRLTTTGGAFNGRLYQSIVDPAARA